eukprot:Awhi_evm1s15776
MSKVIKLYQTMYESGYEHVDFEDGDEEKNKLRVLRETIDHYDIVSGNEIRELQPVVVEENTLPTTSANPINEIKKSISDTFSNLRLNHNSNSNYNSSSGCNKTEEKDDDDDDSIASSTSSQKTRYRASPAHRCGFSFGDMLVSIESTEANLYHKEELLALLKKVNNKDRNAEKITKFYNETGISNYKDNHIIDVTVNSLASKVDNLIPGMRIFGVNGKCLLNFNSEETIQYIATQWSQGDVLSLTVMNYYLCAYLLHETRKLADVSYAHIDKIKVTENAASSIHYDGNKIRT